MGGFGTSGPDSFKGPLGDACSNQLLHCLPIVKFQPIQTILQDIDEKVVSDRSRDQWLFYRYTKGIVAGDIPDDLA